MHTRALTPLLMRFMGVRKSPWVRINDQSMHTCRDREPITVCET